MPLPAGTRVGPYEVVAKLGEGGMGEVYRARDSKLNRDVALKILPEAFASDPERLARFKREAQVLASLNHPNIAQIYGFEDSGGVHALVMELVDGLTLAEIIEGSLLKAPASAKGFAGAGHGSRSGQALSPEPGALSLADALAIARQIADALEAAHEQGIIHRDLKPANVKVRPDGTVKVLDFGLAKAFDPAHGSGLTDHGHLTQSPTITSPAMTQQGVILGTAAYMSPEQARGRPVDKRADIWGFGCVLFEMLAGRRAFEPSTGSGLSRADAGDEGTVSDTLAAILRSEPDWSALPGDTPPAVRTAIRRCLEKDRRRRIADACDVLLLIDELSNVPAASSASAPDRGRSAWARRWFVPLGAAIAGAAVAGAIVWQWRPAPVRPAVKRTIVALPDGDEFSGTGRTFVAVSPDGSRIVYVANQQLFLRPLDQLVATPIPGTSAATSPVFSPDGQQIAFWQGGELKRVPVAGGAPQVICAATNPFGVSWASDATILFGQGGTGILRVSADGGQPSVVVPVDEKKAEVLYGPQLLPDGRTILFSVDSRQTLSGSLPWDDADIVIQDLDSGRRTVIVQGGTEARFLPTGHLVFARQETLWAVPFDPRTGNKIGSPVSMVEGLRQVGTSGGIGVGGLTGSAQFVVSANGLLAYVERDTVVLSRTLVWVDRQGQETPIPLPARSYAYPRIAPDGTRVALDIRDGGQDIWVLDLEPLNLRKLTFDPAPDIAPEWTPDGRRIAFFRSGGGVFVQSADGTGSAERLIESGSNPFAPRGFAAGPDRLMFDENTTAGWSVKLLDLQSQKVADLITLPNANAMNSTLSPDRRWLAYQAADRGGGTRVGIYVRPFPDVEAGQWQIACDECTRPVWARNGRELFFLGGGLQTSGVTSVWAVPVESSPTFRPGTPRKLFEGRYFAQLLGSTYDVSPDGRFLMVKPSSDTTATKPRIVVIDNWTEELKQRVPMQP